MQLYWRSVWGAAYRKVSADAGLSGTAIWVQLGSNKRPSEFLTTPKVAASAVECQSVTVERDLDTVEVSGSSFPFQWTMHMLVGDASDG